MVSAPRIAIAAGTTVLLIVAALVVLVDNPDTAPTRLRERVILADDVTSALTGATVSIRAADPIMIDVAVGAETVCIFEARRPRVHFASTGGDTWVVNVRRISSESRTVDVRVDRIPDSGESAGCRTENRDDGG